MTAAAKCCCGLLVAGSVVMPKVPYGVYGTAALYCAILFIITGSSPRSVLRGNLFIIVFAFVFMIFGLVSGLIEGVVDYERIVRTSASILLIFNIMYSLKLWMGKNGTLSIINSMPSTRLKVYLMLMWTILAAMRRSVPRIVHQVRARVELSTANRWLIARYYIQNLISKELFIMRNLQVSAYLRFQNDISLWTEREVLSVADIVVLSAGVCIAVFVLLCRAGGLI
ncbi:MAG TPA: hypothetical protein ENN21_10405 [Spirochaetes bacterium]|nr:hypothetical protein [Spirochaetota bacterium]